MARFYVSAHGSAKTEATRMGTTASGIGAHVRGWDVGVKVVGSDKDGEDLFDVWMTSGSNGHTSSVLLGTVLLREGKPYFYQSAFERRA